MKINTKDVGMFAGGAIVGTVIGGAVVIYNAVTSKTIGPAIAKAIAEKLVDSVIDKPERVSYKKSNKVSYRSYSYRNSKFDTDILFNTYDEAVKVRDALVDIHENYGLITVADLYDLVGIDTNYTANKYGWVNIHTIPIEQDRNGYILKMPRPMPVE